MSKRPSSQKLSFLALVTLLALAGVTALDRAGALQRLEHIAYDWRMRWARADSRPDPRLAVVLIDDASLQALEPQLGRFPWPRSVYAELLDYLAGGGARAVVFDVLFSERDLAQPNGADGDGALVVAGSSSGLAYHAMQLMRDLDDEGRPLPVAALPADFAAAFGSAPPQGDADLGLNRYLIPFPALYRSARGVGVVGLEPDPDGVYRRAPLLWPYAGNDYPALGVAPLMPSAGAQGAGAAGLFLDPLQAPLDEQGRYAFAMVGRFEPYSIAALLDSHRQLAAGATPLVDPAEFAGKTVFVGAAAAGLQDLKATSIDARAPGVLVHASIASNLLQRDVYRPLGEPAAWLLVLLMALGTAAAALWPRNLWQQLLAPGVPALALVGTGLALFAGGVVVPLAAPLLAAALAWLLASAALAFTEGRDKRRVRTMLGQYVSPAVLQTVVDRHRDRVTAEVGSSETLTVLFSDVRGFTSLSENLAAPQVVDLLNTHFSAMTEIVFRHGGTLDKFIGDAMMAFWGAPLPARDHADLALRAAIDMQLAMAEVNRQLAAKGYPAISIGIGINTGEMVLGNVGSERKLDYTVVGDNVNLASRLEGLTKFYACPVVISEYTYAALADRPPCVPLDQVRVRGRSRPLRIYAPLQAIPELGGSPGKARLLQQQVEEAFAAYLAGDWQRATDAYARVELGRLRELYLDRCMKFADSPPIGPWEGVYSQVGP